MIKRHPLLAAMCLLATGAFTAAQPPVEAPPPPAAPAQPAPAPADRSKLPVDFPHPLITEIFGFVSSHGCGAPAGLAVDAA